MKKETIYICDFCSMRFDNKEKARNHEENCIERERTLGESREIFHKINDLYLEAMKTLLKSSQEIAAKHFFSLVSEKPKHNHYDIWQIFKNHYIFEEKNKKEYCSKKFECMLCGFTTNSKEEMDRHEGQERMKSLKKLL